MTNQTTSYRVVDCSGRQCDGQLYGTLEQAQRAAEFSGGSYLDGPHDHVETDHDGNATDTECWYVYPSEEAAEQDDGGTDAPYLPKIVKLQYGTPKKSIDN